MYCIVSNIYIPHSSPDKFFHQTSSLGRICTKHVLSIIGWVLFVCQLVIFKATACMRVFVTADLQLLVVSNWGIHPISSYNHYPTKRLQSPKQIIYTNLYDCRYSTQRLGTGFNGGIKQGTDPPRNYKTAV